MSSYHDQILACPEEGSASNFSNVQIEELGIARLEQLRTQMQARLDVIDGALRAARTVPMIDIGE